MRNLVAILFILLITSLAYGQEKISNLNSNEIKFESLHIEVSVDSAEELESTFKINDLKSMLNQIEEDEEVSFKVICNGKVLSNGIKSNITYKVNGNSKNAESFLKRVEKIKKVAIQYYKNKKG